MNVIYTDVLVIGGGLAGLRVAIGAKRRGHDVIILSLVPPKRSHSAAAQGGMQASLGNVIKGQGDNCHHLWRFAAPRHAGRRPAAKIGDTRSPGACRPDHTGGLCRAIRHEPRDASALRPVPGSRRQDDVGVLNGRRIDLRKSASVAVAQQFSARRSTTSAKKRESSTDPNHA